MRRPRLPGLLCVLALFPGLLFAEGKRPGRDDRPSLLRGTISQVDPDRKEAVVNSATRDGYVVVDRLAGGFVLRRGALVTRIVNDGYRDPEGRAEVVKPGKRHRGLFK